MCLLFFLSKETDGLSGDGQEVLVGQGSQRLVKQLLGDGLCGGGEGRVVTSKSALSLQLLLYYKEK